MFWPKHPLSPRFAPLLLLIILAGASATVSSARAGIPLITYGPAAPPAEGDDDYRQILFIRIAPEVSGPIHLRVYDPDVGGTYDALSAGADTRTRFRFYGGPGAYTEGQEPPDSEASAPTTGVLLGEAVYGVDPGTDGVWRSLTQFEPRQGEALPDGRYFRLVVEGLAGDDGNAFRVQVSRSPEREAPLDAKIFAYKLTLRHNQRDRFAEIPLNPVDGLESMTTHGFDLGGAALSLETAFRSLPMKASGQGEWRATPVQLLPEEQGQPLALHLGGVGAEYPNDVGFFVRGPAGPLQLELPVRLTTPRVRPELNITTETLADCRSVAFDAAESIDPQGDKLRYRWDFGDGGTGEGSAPIHAYPGPGTYAIRVSAEPIRPVTPRGSLERFTLRVNDPPVARAGPDRVVAIGEQVRLDGSASIDRDGRLTAYRWRFDDGREAQGVETQRRFERAGRYDVALEVTDDSGQTCNTGTDRLQIQVNEPPVAEIGTPLVVAPGESFTLDARRSYDVDGRIDTYRWTMGDGTTYERAVVEHRYEASGTYRVDLTVRDDADVANSSARDEVTITVNRPPRAVAGPDRVVAVGEVVVFDAADSVDPDGNLTAYRWDFGDGKGAEQARTTHAYPEPGEYTVTLTVEDDAGVAGNQGKDQLVVRVNAPPQAEAGPDQSLTGSAVRFDGTSSSDPDGRIVAYRWDFGDGTRGEGAQPEHVYRQPGRYRVRLQVEDNSETIRNFDEDWTEVLINARPIADAGPDRVAAPGEPVTLEGIYSQDPDGTISRYHWDLGDGTTARGPRVEATYPEPGRYTVKLTVADNSGHPEATDWDYARIQVNAPPVPQAGPDRFTAPGERLVFDGARSHDPDGTITRYEWRFSDGRGGAEAPTAERVFTEGGRYTAYLRVEDDSGALNQSAEDRATVRINHPPNAEAGKDRFTCDTTVVFSAADSNDPDNDPLHYRWSFGDGSPGAMSREAIHTYTAEGSYPVSLTVDDGTGLDNSLDRTGLRVTINQPPIAVAGPNRTFCTGDTVLFDGSESRDPEGGVLRYLWDFGDGRTGEGVSPSRVYAEPGRYRVGLQVKDDSGLSCDSHRDEQIIEVLAAPRAVAGADVDGCAHVPISFDGTASEDHDGVVDAYRWDFGDGNTTGGARPVHTFAAPGTYTVRLTIEGDPRGECPNTHSDTLTARIQPGPEAVIQMPEAAPINATVTFDGSPSQGKAGTIQRWSWELGDGTTAQGPTVSHRYTEAGDYRVRLTIDTDNSQADCATATAERRLRINAAPIADAGPDRTVAVREPLRFDTGESYDPDGVLTRYRWDFGDGSPPKEGIAVSHRYMEPGEFPVTLTVEDGSGLANGSATDRARVRVNDTPRPRIAAPAVACVDESVALAGHVEDQQAEDAVYRWRFGDGASDVGTEVRHRYGTPGRYNVELRVDDRTGLANGIGTTQHSLLVNRPPAVFAGHDAEVCPGEEVRFEGMDAADRAHDSLAFRWQLDGETRIEGPVATHRYPAPGRYEAVLEVDDGSGSSCATAEDRVITAVNHTPSVAIRGPEQGFTGGAHDELVFTAAARDPNDERLEYRWDFGDGSMGEGPVVRHRYAEAGRYEVTVTVRDDSDLPCGQAEARHRVTVQDRP
jgi:PKD repeat protein